NYPALYVGVEVNSAQCRFLCARHHFGWGTVIRGLGIVGFGQGRIETGVFRVLSNSSLEILNCLIHAFTRAFSEFMETQKVFIVAFQIDRRGGGGTCLDG